MKILVAAALLITSFACGGTPTVNCPGQENPSRMTNAQLDAASRRSVPERQAVTKSSVSWTADHRRAYLERNFKDVEDVGVGRGFGVTFTLDQFGKATYHRERDHMVVVKMRNKAACPDTIEGGTLFLFGQDENRVPVRFVYLKT